MVDYSKQGKANRLKGAKFELKVRRNLESQGWTVDKFTNNVDLDIGIMIPAKSNRFRSRSTGFPDFICWRSVAFKRRSLTPNYKIILVESKFNGTLTKTEKLKLQWLKEEDYKIFVAFDENGEVKYREFVEYKGPDSVRGTKARFKTR